jgi:hypothetical protein
VAFSGTEELVADAEARLGRRLPEDHRQRLIENNGGEIRVEGEFWTLFPVWDPTNRQTMRRTANHIVRENDPRLNPWADLLPPGLVAIANNGGGDLLVLAPGSDQVSFWDHETGELSAARVTWR